MLFNSINPMLFILLFGAFATTVGRQPLKGYSTGLLLLGLFLGSASWWLVLSSAIVALRSKFSARLVGASNMVAAAVMASFGVTALVPLIR